jgi:hypothetical protein
VSDSAFGSDLLRDVLYSITVPLTVTLSGPGIAPSTSYDLTFWTLYGLQDKQMVVAPVSGTGGASIGPSVLTAPGTEHDNTSNNLTGTFTSSGTGVLTFNLTSQTSNIHLTNGFSIAAAAGPDATPPDIATLDPVNTAIDVVVNTDLVITFDEVVQVGTGNIVIQPTGGGDPFETIDVTSGNVTVVGAVVTIDPPNSTSQTNNTFFLLCLGVLRVRRGV